MTMAKKKKQAEPTVEKPAAEKPKAVKKPKIVIPSVEDLTELIKRAMENQGTYSPDLEFAITNAATNYRLLLIARKDVSKLSKTMTASKNIQIFFMGAILSNEAFFVYFIVADGRTGRKPPGGLKFSETDMKFFSCLAPIRDFW